jgi:hypothetical protein
LDREQKLDTVPKKGLDIKALAWVWSETKGLNLNLSKIFLNQPQFWSNLNIKKTMFELFYLHFKLQN